MNKTLKTYPDGSEMTVGLALTAMTIGVTGTIVYLGIKDAIKKRRFRKNELKWRKKFQ